MSCSRCGTKAVVAKCCPHLAKGLATFDSSNEDTSLVCTGCRARDASLPICAQCVEAVRVHNVPVSDRRRPFGFADRTPYLKVHGIDRPWMAAPHAGDLVKVGLSTIPRRKRWLESLWVRVHERTGDRLRGTVENDPVLFSPDQLKDGSWLEFTIDQVVDVTLEDELADRPHTCGQCLGEGRKLDAVDQKLLSDVRTFGFHVIKVMSDEEGPGFAYTIGLHHRFEHPEVIFVGDDLELTHGVLNRIGIAAADGRQLPRVLEGVESRLVEPKSKKVRGDYFGFACWFYRGEDFPVRQLIWPGCETVL